MTEKRYFMRCDEINAWSVHETGKDVIVFDLFKSDAKIICNKLNEQDTRITELEKENEQLKQTSQDYEDIVNNWFIDNWNKLSDEMKQSAHLEVGIDIEYDGDVE